MKHLGDITKISGVDAPIVDCIIGGSPCQDLSVAGRRVGLDGERSGLYMEQIRIVKEMRQKDEASGRTGVDVRPRFMLWENVPGAFSSNGGRDFQIVLEEIAKVSDKNAVIPRPADGRWRNAGSIVGRGWSVAWRVLDAQFWGVPQRRRRIALVADFGGESAPEILFIRNCLQGNTDEGKQTRKEAASNASRGVGANDRLGADQYNAVILGDTVSTLGVNCGMSHGRQCILEPSSVYSVENHPNDSRVGINEEGKVQALTSRMGTGGDNVPMVMQQCYSKQKRAQSATDNETWVESDTANTLNAFDVGDTRTTECVVCGVDAYNQALTGDVAKTLNSIATDSDHIPSVIYALDRASFNQGKNAQFNFEVSDNGINSSLVAKGPGAVCYEKPKTRYIVRRLTPLERERLQGYPDGWTHIGEWTDTNGKKRQTSDAARYKALGNSISLPNWKWVLKRLCACYERDATMASLFDGISGFPLLWTQLNGWGSVLWTSEIEEFTIAVCKRHFGDEETGEKGDFYEAILGRNKTENE